jgi:hypothetical protein
MEKTFSMADKTLSITEKTFWIVDQELPIVLKPFKISGLSLSKRQCLGLFLAGQSGQLPWFYADSQKRL